MLNSSFCRSLYAFSCTEKLPTSKTSGMPPRNRGAQKKISKCRHRPHPPDCSPSSRCLLELGQECLNSAVCSQKLSLQAHLVDLIPPVFLDGTAQSNLETLVLVPQCFYVMYTIASILVGRTRSIRQNHPSSLSKVQIKIELLVDFAYPIPRRACRGCAATIRRGAPGVCASCAHGSPRGAAPSSPCIRSRRQGARISCCEAESCTLSFRCPHLD